jgi:copper chaperone NosL
MSRPLLLVLSATLLSGCTRNDPSGPPQLRLGRDECGECGMIINEDRYSCGIVVERAGRSEPVLFDDIGCMLEYTREHADELSIQRIYVHDHATRAWVPAPEATFLYADETKLPTPMGSGIAAFATKGDADQARARVGGDLLDYAALAPARRAWMEQRYGSPNRAPIGAK